MLYTPPGRQYGEASVIMRPDAIPWMRAWRSIVVTQNQESVPMLHDRVPNGVNGLRIALHYAVQDNSANPRAPLRVILRYGDMRTGSVPVGVAIPGLYTAEIAVNVALFFPVYWVVPSGAEFDLTVYQNFIAAPTIWGYSTGWYF